VVRNHLTRRKKRDALERQRNWLFRALIAREAVRALVIQWRRQPGHWAGVRRYLGLDRLTSWALRRTATPSWRATAVAEAANGRTARKRRIAIERWRAGLDEQRRSQTLPSPAGHPDSRSVDQAVSTKRPFKRSASVKEGGGWTNWGVRKEDSDQRGRSHGLGPPNREVKSSNERADSSPELTDALTNQVSRCGNLSRLDGDEKSYIRPPRYTGPHSLALEWLESARL
jgi:hypothetical protein